MSSMSLRVKYLFVLNGVILSMWTVYAAWSLHKTEEQFMQTEMSSIKYLAIGLGLLVEHHIEKHDTVDGLQDEIESLLPHKSGLDIMLIDDSFMVRLATQKARIGRKWFEDKIRDVFLGERDVIVTDTDHFHAGRRAIDITVGVRNSAGKTVIAVHMARWLDHMSGALNTQLVSHGLFALAMLIVVGVAVNLLTYRIVLKPLRSMNEELNESGWISSHPELTSGNEIEKVQAALHDTIGQINIHTTDLKERLKRSERLAVIGQMGAALAHEIRNPLHIVRGTAETLARRFPGSAVFAADIKEEVDRVERLIEELLQYARQADPRVEEIDARALLESVRERVLKSSIGPLAQNPRLSVEMDSRNVTLIADPVMLEQALANLVINAVEASPEGKPIKMTAYLHLEGDVVFEVIDAGTGIAEEDLEKVTEPFFTRKTQGTGLGLAVVEKIADSHNGSFALFRRESGGTRAVFSVSKSSSEVLK
ncbi:MAG: hypothetical protein GY854_23180 [Deltaproteobacteria bacterium]|nr:hypothetical protein [Deltaproteobacteria bacterium]